MKKQIPVLVDKSHGTKQLLKGLSSTTWDCDILQTMILIGHLTSPPRYRGFHLSTFWAWLRYPPAISQRKPALTLRRSWSEMDSHQKTILADDFGMGFSCRYLQEKHGFEDFADTSFLLKRVLKKIVTHVIVPKRGPAKAPDFIAADAFGKLHILECKGSQATPAYLATAMKNGITQKNNLSYKKLFSSCMVGGLYVPLHDSKSDAQLVYIDPDPRELFDMLKNVDPATIVAEVRRQSLAKTLTAAGLWRSATVLYEGNVAKEDIAFVKNLTTGELQFAGFHQDGEKWKKEIEYRSFEAEENIDDAMAYRTKLTIEVPHDIVKFFNDAVSGEGELPDAVVNKWIDAMTTARRKLAVRTQDGSREVSLARNKNQNNILKGDVEGTSKSSLSISSGVNFELERSPYQ